MNLESTAGIFKKIKVEVRNNLGICQFYFILAPLKVLDENKSFSLSVKQNALVINSQILSLPFDVQPQSLCGLVQNNNVLTFRINLVKSVVKVSPLLPSFPSFDLPDISPVEAGKSYMLHCLQCDKDLLKELIVISRVVTEPMNATDVSDIFCHRSKEVLQFERNNSANSCRNEQPIYLDTGSFKLPFFEIGDMTAVCDENVIRCERCYYWLGLRYSSCKSSVCFWNDTVQVSPSDRKSLNKISELILYKIIVNTLIECFFSVCHILLVCKIEAYEERRLLLTILDRNLQIWECASAESNLKEVPYMKVLFKEVTHDTWDEESIHQSVLVSKPTFVSTLKLLHLHVNEVLFASEKVAYLPIIRDFD